MGAWLRFDVTGHVAGAAENHGFALTSSDAGWSLAGADAIRGVRYGLATQEFWDPSTAPYLRAPGLAVLSRRPQDCQSSEGLAVLRGGESED